MRKCKWYAMLFILLSLLLVLSPVACSQSTETTQESLQDEESTSQKPAEFEVGPITFEPATAMVDDSVTVTTTIENIGGIAGTYTATLAIDGQEIESKDILVDSESSQEVSFQLSKASPGSYNISIGNSSATMTVYEWRPYKIQYDESDGAGTGIYVSGENGHIVHFTPPAKPFRVQKIRVLGRVNLLDIYELDKNHVTVRIWDKEGNNQLWSQDFPWRLFWIGPRWAEIEVPNIRVDDDFHVELITHSNPVAIRSDGSVSPYGGDPIEMPLGWGIRLKGPFDPSSAVLIGFDYPHSYINSPVNHPETRSGYSYMGKPIDPGKDRLKGIRWLIRVEGEGASGN